MERRGKEFGTVRSKEKGKATEVGGRERGRRRRAVGNGEKGGKR